MGRLWAVACVTAGGERRAQKVLEDLGVEVFCPYYRKPVRRRYAARRHRETVRRALFAGYAFVAVDSIGDLEALRGAPGLHGFIRNRGRLSLLPDREIAKLRRLKGNRILSAPSIRRAVQRYLVGDVVRVEGGILDDWLGAVECQRGDRVTVSGHDFGLAVELSAGTLKLEV